MSKSFASPTASLLRSSRLFSLPKALPEVPPETVMPTGIFYTSDTATRPFPSYQSITAPPSSRSRGDYGLKRALPKKGTQRANSGVRVRAMDTFTHITDFESAGDHGMAVKKFQEMAVPLVGRSRRSRLSQAGNRSFYSVYEDEVDITTGAGLKAGGQVRWKFGGPWLAGLSNMEFDLFLKSQVDKAKTKGRWKAAVRDDLVFEKALAARTTAAERGELDKFRLDKVDLRVSDEEVAAEEKRLRDDHAALADRSLTSKMTQRLQEFFDLPPVRNTEFDGDGRLTLTAIRQASGPPTSHPGAGLSYIRSEAFMENHPVHGPQGGRSPVLARVLIPHGTTSTGNRAALGVGGFVAVDNRIQIGTRFEQARAREDAAHLLIDKLNPDRMTTELDLSLPGGNKMYVQPQRAIVDERSRVCIDVVRGDKEAIAVKTGDTRQIEEQRERTRFYSSARPDPDDLVSVFHNALNSESRSDPPVRRFANFGTGLPDLQAPRAPPRTQRAGGVDADPTRAAAQRQTTDRLRGIWEDFEQSR